jgi:AAA15 family ATPase/GTPase
MLAQFRVGNYLSFKHNPFFYMRACKDKEHPEAVAELGANGRLLKACVVIGANASGKSNFINAMRFMVNYVLNSHLKQLNQVTGRTAFKFGPETLGMPSTFEVVFVQGRVKYEYGFALNDTEVTDEYLYHYPHGRKALIFERSHINKYRFTTDVDLQSNLKDRNTANKLYLSTAANWNYEKVIPVFKWFSSWKFIDQSIFGQASEESAEKLRDGEYRSKISKMMKAVDSSISSLQLTEGRTGFGGTLTGVYDHIEVVHHVVAEDGKENVYTLNMAEESRGTRAYFDLIGLVYNTLDSGGILVADDMDAHFHPLLTRKIVALFNSDQHNPRNAQLIFTTKNTNLLDLSLLRRDQVWFSEKWDPESITDVYPLIEYSVRKDMSLEKCYLQGRFGGVPQFPNEML